MSSVLDISFTSSSSRTSESSTTSVPSSTSSSSFTTTILTTSIRSSSAPITTSLTSTIVTTSTSTVSASPSVNGTSKSNLDPGTLAGLVIGGLLAGVVLGGCIWFSIIVARRRMRRRRTVVGTQPEERLMHLEKMRGQAAPPLRDGIAIQSLPPSRNIRVLNWIARTRGAGPPSVSQHTMSERSVHGEEYRGMSAAHPAEDVLSDSSSESQSHYSHPSTLPHASTKSGPRRSSSAVGRPNVSDTRTSFIRMD